LGHITTDRANLDFSFTLAGATEDFVPRGEDMIVYGSEDRVPV
jgi:hypothetical protein